MSMPIMLLVMFSTTIAVMWLGGKSVAAGTLMVGQLSGFLTYVSQILMALMMLSMVLMMLSRSVASVRRVIEVIEEEPDITGENADRGLAVADGSVRFEDVWFKYNDTSPEWNLSGVDLSIRAGQTVGVIGATGSGKTTLVQLIARLYDTTKGRVLVGGRDVRDYDIQTLRGAVAMVLQKNTLFSGTIRENLRWGKSDATQEEMDEACRSACADEFIARFADGYETDLGQGGVNLSGGQKQRLCIARALLKKPKVLILDDSTSAVDMSTDAKIRHALRTALAETTKIIIAQRIASVSDADLIVVLDEGRVSAAGTHDELMKTSEIYRDVYLSQSEGVGLNG
jgi:ATP-binding cassette subfamily B protein